jgi:SAM-dependent methyltransferase
MSSSEAAPATGSEQARARAREVWALGDYDRVSRDVLEPFGPALVHACRVGPGVRVLDVAAGTGNAAIPAAQRGAHVTASDLTPELLQAGSRVAEATSTQLEWVTADAEHLPFEDESYDIVMSSIGVMFAPHHQQAADELVRVCRAGGTIGLLSWTPEGMLGALFRMLGQFAPPPPAGASPPPLWGSETHLTGLMGDAVEWRSMERQVLDITAFKHPLAYGEHFKARYGPAIGVRANAARNGRAEEFDAALDDFCREWNVGSETEARFEMEYLLSVGTRR